MEDQWINLENPVRDRTGQETSRTLNGVADSGFIWTIGAIRTTPANSVGRSHAVRMEMAPPWMGTRRKIY